MQRKAAFWSALRIGLETFVGRPLRLIVKLVGSAVQYCSMSAEFRPVEVEGARSRCSGHGCIFRCATAGLRGMLICGMGGALIR